jgi:inosose dehydratase
VRLPDGVMGFACQTYSWQMSGERYRGRLDHVAAVAAEAGFPALEPEVWMLGEYCDPARLHDVLDAHDLRLAALALALPWTNDGETSEERAEADTVISLLAHFPGAKLVLVQLPGVDRSDLAVRQARAVACMNAVARRALAAGVGPTVHPNSPLGSLFRVRADYDLLLDRLHPDVGFTPDVGHVVAGGMDPIDLIGEYRGRVDHVHFKDIDAAGGWAPTGRGIVDFPAVVALLVDGGYRGWLVFEDESAEAERDPDAATRSNGVYARDVLLPVSNRVL